MGLAQVDQTALSDKTGEAGEPGVASNEMKGTADRAGRSAAVPKSMFSATRPAKRSTSANSYSCHMGPGDPFHGGAVVLGEGGAREEQ